MAHGRVAGIGQPLVELVRIGLGDGLDSAGAKLRVDVAPE